MDAQIDGVWTNIIGNDGMHPPLLKCSSKSITFIRNKPVPIRVYYFQGLAHIMANMLHWRKLASPNGALGTDVSCNAGGDGQNEYFYIADGSIPKATYTDFIKRNWSLVPENVFYLPNTIVNPCTSL